MPTVKDAIYGWSPAGDDDVEVNISQDMYFTSINCITPSTSFLSPVCPPLDITPPGTGPPSQSQSPPSGSLTGIPQTAIAPSSDRRAQRNRNRDPSWIPRPRNAFIIFRCEYSREHAQSAQDSKEDQDPTVAVKTLSKRAAEAWKRLSVPEREKYKLLADREREEHARLYPHYRFRPMKRQVSGAGNRSSERSQSPRVATVESHTQSSVRLPSVLSAAPEKTPSCRSVGRAKMSEPMPQEATLFPDPSFYPVDMSGPDPEASLGMDYNDTILFYPTPDATLRPDSPPPSATVELYSPLHTSAANIPTNPFYCNDSIAGLGLDCEGLERVQDLEAYSIGLYHHDVFSPFAIPES